MINTHATCHLIFGALGQDGSYLAEQLSAEGKEVIGVIRSSSVVPNAYLHENINYVRGDILDSGFVYSLLETYEPTHVYNLASASSVAESYLRPDLSLNVNFEFVRILIESIEKYRASSGREIFLLHASSSEMFGPDQQSPITEKTDHNPRSPYAEHKSMAHNLCLRARRDRDIKIGVAILFNHESPRRPLKFVSRKITHGAYLISKGIEKKLTLGNIGIARDWGYAPDYVNAMKLIAENTQADDFIIATGKLHSLEDMCRVAFEAKGLGDFTEFVESDRSLYREVENSGLIGLADKARLELNWRSRLTFEEMIRQMVFQES